MSKPLAQKRWYCLIPIVFIAYSRANFGFALTGGMAHDLNITAAMSSLLCSLFFLGYFFFQISGALYAGRVGKGISAQAPHKTVLETLTSHGFSHCSAKRILHFIGLNPIIPKLLSVVFS